MKTSYRHRRRAWRNGVSLNSGIGAAWQWRKGVMAYRHQRRHIESSEIMSVMRGARQTKA